jgi:uncharacterized membrane protein
MRASWQRLKEYGKTMWPACCLALIGVLVFSGFAITRHERLNSSTYDLGIKDQVIWNTSQGRWFASSVEVTHYLGDHVQLIFLPLALLYRLWPDVRLLLVIQAAGLAAGVLPLYWLALRRLGNRGLALAFSFLYLCYPALGFINRFGFHAVSFSIPLFLFAYWSLESQRPRLATLFVLLALCCREEVGLTVSALGVYVLLARRGKKWGALWALAGVAWSLIAMFVVIPAFRGTASDTLGRYGWLGDSPVAMLHTLLTRPGYVIDHQFVAAPFRWQFLLRLLLPLGFLSLLNPSVLAIGLPSLAYNLLSKAPPQSSIYFQYVSPAIPFLFLAALEGMGWLNGRIGTSSARRRWQRVLVLLLATGTFSALVLDNPFSKPIDEPYFEVYAWEQKVDREAFERVAQHVPADASLSTMMAYGPHLSHRQQLYLFYDKGARGQQVFRFPQTDYLLLNLDDLRWLVNPRLFYPMIEAAISCYGYEGVALDGEVALLQRDASPRPETAEVLARAIERWESGGKYAPVSQHVLADIARWAQGETLPGDHTPFNLRFGQQIELAGGQVTPSELALSAERVVTVSLYWRAVEPIAQHYMLFIHLADPTGWVHVQRDTESGWGFYPTPAWPAGALMRDVRSLPLPDDLPPGEYRVRVGWYALPDVQRLPVIQGGEVIGDAVDIGSVIVRP